MHALSLQSLLETTADSCVALLGAGGKTTLMLALAEGMRAAGYRPIVTTTTRIWPPAGIPLVLGTAGALDEALSQHEIACLGDRLSSEGKVEGLPPAALCELRARRAGPLLVEADGAAGRPLKAHGAHEPVVPTCATHVLIVAGVDAVGQPAGDDVVHRFALAAAVHSWTAGETITSAHVAALLRRMERYVPVHARSWFVLNKVDDPARARIAEDITEHLGERRTHVLMASQGRPVVLSGRAPGAVRT
jgi:probable selenium-dependent hydroxylase accessory protein YqeC